MRINLLQLGTEGVDMKTNPLLLGNKKLHAATNLIFDEGVIRTRPGFRYSRQKAAGQFQGAGEFRPRLGISSGRMSEVSGGVVIVAGGEVWSGCTLIGDGFFCKGDVNVFQAENYLILQCLETPTYWWDGINGLVESIGMNEQDWRDPETPVQELEIEVPVADTPSCEIETGITVTFNVINSATEEVISGALITVFQNGNRAYQGTSNSFGKYQIKPLAGAYIYSVVMAGFDNVDNADFVAGQNLVEYEFDDCVAPMTIESGETEVNVRLKVPLSSCDFVTNVHSFVTVPEGAYSLSSLFDAPLVAPSLAAEMRWRLITDDCGYNINYGEGFLDSSGRLSIEDFVDNLSSSGLDVETLNFNSTYTYPEGMYLQLGSTVCGETTLWPERTCIEGYTNETP